MADITQWIDAIVTRTVTSGSSRENSRGVPKITRGG